MFRRIVVAYDGSPRGEDALALAQRLRHPAEGELTLVCTVAERPWHRSGRGRHGNAAVPEDIAATLAAGRAKVAPGVHVKLRAPVASSPARGLTELAEDEHADLVVAGSSRRSPSGRIWLERTAGRLLQGAPCAVAVAPADLQDTDPFRHVGIAYDESAEAAAALAAGYEIAASTGAAVTLLHALADAAPLGAVSPGTDLEREGHKARLHAQELLDTAADSAPPGVNPRTLLLYGLPGRVIAEACDGIVDLLVTGSRGYGPVQRALMGSVAEALMDGASHPVLVLPRRPATAADRVPASGGQKLRTGATPALGA